MDKIKTIAVLTGGGDCPGLNAVIRAIVKTSQQHNIKVLGIKNGFKGLVLNEMLELNNNSISGILPRGGTILGASNRDNPFNFAVEADGQIIYQDLSQTALKNLTNAHIDALVVIGGDGTIAIAEKFSKLGVNIIAVPKTIDNDLPLTERTFGFDTAISIATEALDRLHSTAESHHRVMILEVMGRYAGWIALHAGIAGGADCILIPEIPYDIHSVINTINHRQQYGKLFSIIVVAEGAACQGGNMTIAKIVENSPDKIRLGGAGQKLAAEIEAIKNLEVRCTVLGHLQRGGSPTAYDRILATRYGEAAVNALINGKSNVMVALQKNLIIEVPIEKIAGKVNKVSLENQLLTTARSIGIGFGD